MRGHRIFAGLYDRMLSGTERAGLRDMRAELLAEARGRTLELGAGTGLNLAHYTDAVTELVLTEPDPHMARRLRKRLDDEPPAPDRVEVVETPAERLPFEDGSFDSVVSTLVLCSVETPAAATGEIVRVLKPDGRLLTLEHVRSPDSGLARWQDRLERPWGWLGAGCHPNRDTVAELETVGLETASLVRDRMPKAPPIVRPVVRGIASLSR
ncbi:MAG: class I SAM-dependent methyltransferase [Actinomycetota bacterium]